MSLSSLISTIVQHGHRKEQYKELTSVPKFPATFISVDSEVVCEGVSWLRNGYFKIFSLRLRVRVGLPVPAFTAGVPTLLAGVGGDVLESGAGVGRVDHTLGRSHARHAVTPRMILRGKQWRPDLI